MQDLSSTTGENVHIAVLEGAAPLCIDRISGRRAIQVMGRPGVRLPLHVTGVGKVLLADADPELQRHCLQNLTRITPHTVVEPQRLIRQLAEVRSRGYAITSEEMTIGACSIAAPIRAADGHVIAELGVVTGSRHQGRNRLIPAVQLAARSVRCCSVVWTPGAHARSRNWPCASRTTTTACGASPEPRPPGDQGGSRPRTRRARRLRTSLG